MKRISSGLTLVQKKVFPVAWFGLWGIGLVAGIVSGEYRENALVIIGPAAAMALGYLLFRTLIWDLADEVLDGGQFLLVRQGGQEERVQLSNIMNVSVSTMTNPVRITLRLVTPGRFGREITFMPPFGSSWRRPFAMNPVAEDLMIRANAARTRRAA